MDQSTAMSKEYALAHIRQRPVHTLPDVCSETSKIPKQFSNILYAIRIRRVISKVLRGKWLSLARVKGLIFLCLCVFSININGATATPQAGCIYSHAPDSEHGPVLSINCSNMGLPGYTLDVREIIGHNNTGNNLTSAIITNNPPKIHNLDLSHNKLTSVEPQVQEHVFYFNITFPIECSILNFSDNSITQIQAEHFSKFTKVVSLDLSRNYIYSLDEETFVEQVTISTLNLSHNALEDFENNTFVYLKNLVILDLSFNSLKIFQLSMLSSLQYLYLNNNNLLSITSSIITPVINTPQLLLLDISNNQLHDLPLGALISLKILNLANNSILEASENIFQRFPRLEELNLDMNDILSINKPVFQNTSLRRLSIASMPNLRNISHDTFSGLHRLQYLNLSHNLLLSFIQPNLFTPLVNMEILDLSSSGITQLSQITFHKNDKLRKIYLLNNPFRCSCTNAWLADEASNNHSRFAGVSSLRCLSDNGILTDVTNSSFYCDKISINDTSYTITAKLGSQLLLKCQHLIENPGIVMWTTPTGATFYQHHFHPDASQHLLTPEDIQPGSAFHYEHYWHHTTSYHSELSSSPDRISVLSDGSLYIDYMLRSDPGPYKCQVSNAQYNNSITVKLYLDCRLSSDIKIFGCIAGLICALSFFTLNLIYVTISWVARRLVNKRRREIIRQMLENLNTYKSSQMARIYENYTHQLTRVRHQYHTQCDRLHKNYTHQVAKMKRGCSNQVERVRDNYNSRLTQLRDYSSSQIMQIRERTTCQIVRIRDYGTTQLDKLRETYKFQQQHVMKLLDTMNLENCRSIVETECMRAESMMYDIDLLGDDDRTESPTSPPDSEYSTAASSPSSSLYDADSAGLTRSTSQKTRDFSTDSSDNSNAVIQVQTTIDLEPGLSVETDDTWNYDEACNYSEDCHPSFLQLHDDPSFPHLHNDTPPPLTASHSHKVKTGVPLPTLFMNQKHSTAHKRADSDSHSEGLYVTPEASPTKVWSGARAASTLLQNDNEVMTHRVCDTRENFNKETIV